MFFVDDNFSQDASYSFQFDFYLRGVCYFLGVIILLEILRNQITEVDLLQLIPGFYFFIFLLAVLFLVYVSYFIGHFPFEIDILKEYGTNMRSKMLMNIFFKFSFLLFFTLLLILINNVIPLSLDTFSISVEKNLQNTWSLGEVILVEILLLMFLISISQLPLYFFFNFHTLIRIESVSQFWKLIGFGMTVLAGFLTPTLDGYTQVSFALSSFLFYLLVVNFLQKRTFLKFYFFLPFGS